MIHNKRYRKMLLNCLWSGILFSILMPAAGNAAFQGNTLPVEETPLGAKKLDQLRGGFVTDNGFMVKFSFQKLVEIDGEPRFETYLNVPELHLPTFEFTADSAQMTSGQIEKNTVIQIGSNNHIARDALNNSAAYLTFIQNSLDNKRIQHTRIFNIEISNYRFQSNIPLNSRINAQLFESLR